MSIKIKSLPILGLLVLSVHVQAENVEKSAWKSAAEIGYVNVSGNTNTETTKAVFDISYETKSWIYKVHADALSAKTETTDTTVIPEQTTFERTAAKWLVSG